MNPSNNLTYSSNRQRPRTFFGRFLSRLNPLRTRTSRQPQRQPDIGQQGLRQHGENHLPNGVPAEIIIRTALLPPPTRPLTNPQGQTAPQEQPAPRTRPLTNPEMRAIKKIDQNQNKIPEYEKKFILKFFNKNFQDDPHMMSLILPLYIDADNMGENVNNFRNEMRKLNDDQRDKIIKNIKTFEMLLKEFRSLKKLRS